MIYGSILQPAKELDFEECPVELWVPSSGLERRRRLNTFSEDTHTLVETSGVATYN